MNGTDGTSDLAGNHHNGELEHAGKARIQTSVSIIGLGKLGACMAAAMASRGVRTVGVDIHVEPIEKIQQKLAPVFEPGLAEMIASCDGLLHATSDFESALRDTQITFVIVPTPSTPDGAFSLEHVCSAMGRIGRSLRNKSGYHTIVLTSTVLPGSTEYVVKPLLENASGKTCGRDFGLCYSPEFIALGSVLRDFLNPDLLLIGEYDSLSGEHLATFYRETLGIDAPVVRIGLVNAELAKIALNTFVTTKITFANLLAEICERLPGGDVDAVTQALGLDRRIGSKYLKGALGYGGPCFPRDNSALAKLLEELGVSSELPRTVDRLNRSHASRIASLVEESGFRPPDRIAVLGLAYKPHTNVVEESPGIAIANELVSRGYKVTAYDPVAIEQARNYLDGVVQFAANTADCARDARMVIIATDWPEFRSVLHQTATSRPKPLILDGWRLLRSDQVLDSLSYRAIGICHSPQKTTERLRSFIERLGNPIHQGIAEAEQNKTRAATPER